MKIFRGDIYLVSFDPVIGTEIAKTRPAIVVSHTAFNNMARNISVIPISSGKYIRSFHVKVSGLKPGSHAILPQLRAVSKKRVIKKIGTASELELDQIKEKLIRYLDIR